MTSPSANADRGTGTSRLHHPAATWRNDHQLITSSHADESSVLYKTDYEQCVALREEYLLHMYCGKRKISDTIWILQLMDTCHSKL